MKGRVLLLGALVAGGLAACGGDGSPDPWTLLVDGSVRLGRDGATRVLDGGEHKVERGDDLEVTKGRAVLVLPRDARLELREGRDADDSRLHVANVPELLDGEMLLVGGERGTEATAGAATVGITDGAVRVRRGASVTVGVYAGRPRLEARGRVLEALRPLRQATVTDSGALPRELQPVTYDPDDVDPWDNRYLGDAIDLDDQIELRRSAVAKSADAGDLTPVLGDLAKDVRAETSRSTAETVVGAAIARAGARGDLAQRWDEVFSFRDDGAPWGVVALDQEAKRSAVLDTLDGVVRRLRQRFGGIAAARSGDRGEVAIGGTPGTTTPPSGGGRGGDGGGSTPPTTEPPSPLPTVPPTSPMPTIPLPPLPIVGGGDDDGGGDGGTTPSPGGSESGPLEQTVDTVVTTVEQVPVVGDVVGDILEQPLTTTLTTLLGG